VLGKYQALIDPINISKESAMKIHMVSDSSFKLSSLFLVCAASFALTTYAQAAQVLGVDQKVVTVNSDTARDPVPVAPQLDKDGPLQVVRQMAANEKIYFFARGKAVSSTSGNMMLGLQVFCRGATSKKADYLWSTRNHEGNDAYVDAKGVLSLDVRYLFTAPVADAYTCTLNAQNYRGKDAVASEDYWTLMKGADNTFLSVDYSVPNSIGWGTENDPKDDKRAQAAGKDTAEYSTNYVNIGPTDKLFNKTREDVLRSPQWIPTSTSIKAFSDIELTSCYYGTGSCEAYAQGTKADQSQNSVVKTRLIVDQIPAGSTTPCATTATDFAETKITWDAHHQKIYHSLNSVPVLKAQSSCGDGSYFSSRVDVQWVSGNPVRVENSHYSHGAFMNL
jgi:hypothetical protein